MNITLYDDPNIPGIPTHTEGAKLSFAGYKNINVPYGYSNVIPYNNGSAFAKSFEKDNVLYISIAGTDNIIEFTSWNDFKESDLPNWFTEGYNHFQKLDPQLGPVIMDAIKKGKQIVVLGDSGGGLAAQFFRHKYGVDIYITNTAHVSKEAYKEITDQSSLAYSRAVALNLSGEPLSMTPYLRTYGWGDIQVFHVPSELGIKTLLGEAVEGTTFGYSGSRLALHKDKRVLVGEYGNLPIQNRIWTIDDYRENPSTKHFYNSARNELSERYWEKLQKEEFEHSEQGNKWLQFYKILENRYPLVSRNGDFFQLYIDGNYYDAINV